MSGSGSFDETTTHQGWVKAAKEEICTDSPLLYFLLSLLGNAGLWSFLLSPRQSWAVVATHRWGCCRSWWHYLDQAIVAVRGGRCEKVVTFTEARKLERGQIRWATPQHHCRGKSSMWRQIQPRRGLWQRWWRRRWWPSCDIGDYGGATISSFRLVLTSHPRHTHLFVLANTTLVAGVSFFYL